MLNNWKDDFYTGQVVKKQQSSCEQENHTDFSQEKEISLLKYYDDNKNEYKFRGLSILFPGCSGKTVQPRP